MFFLTWIMLGLLFWWHSDNCDGGSRWSIAAPLGGGTWEIGGDDC
ncbi:hypothetical protein HanPSC8_Chr12g0531511 [Helianthus annuus]|nr:hypothetical protein HanPSC8_Chr12g0531511 [Helianthus annuus]